MTDEPLPHIQQVKRLKTPKRPDANATDEPDEPLPRIENRPLPKDQDHLIADIKPPSNLISVRT